MQIQVAKALGVSVVTTIREEADEAGEVVRITDGLTDRS